MGGCACFQGLGPPPSADVSYDGSFNEVQRLELEERVIFLQTVSLFRMQLPKKDIIRVAHTAEDHSFSREEILVKQGEMGEELWIIRRGAASIRVDGKEKAVLCKGDYWGDGTLVRKRESAATLVSMGSENGGDLEVLKISRKAFEELRLNTLVKFPKRPAIYNGKVKGGGNPADSVAFGRRGSTRAGNTSAGGMSASSKSVPADCSPRGARSLSRAEEDFIVDALQHNANLNAYLQVEPHVLRESLASQAERILVQAGEDISLYGDYPDAMWAIHTGYVDVVSGNTQEGITPMACKIAVKEQSLQDLLLETINVRKGCPTPRGRHGPWGQPMGGRPMLPEVSEGSAVQNGANQPSSSQSSRSSPQDSHKACSVIAGALGPGDIFGELSLLFNTGRVATFRASASGDVELFRMSRRAFKKSYYMKIPEFEEWCSLLDDVQMLGSLFTFQRHELARNAQGYQTFQPGEQVIEQGAVLESRMRCLYVVASGSATLTNTLAKPDSQEDDAKTSTRSDAELEEDTGRMGSMPTRVFNSLSSYTLRRGDTFGESSMFHVGRRETAEATVTAGSKGLVCLCVQGQLFKNLNLDLEDVSFSKQEGTVNPAADALKLKKAALSWRKANTKRTSLFMAGAAKELDPESLRNVAFLGCGAFALVVLQKDESTGKMYALKRMSKGLIQAKCAEKHVCAERDLMSLLANPFICRLRASYQDEQFLYMVQDAVLGGTLEGVCYSHRDIMDQKATMFYTACIMEAIEYLHGLHIAYRDLKPENVLLDTKGYAHLCDFGFARFAVKPTHTMCGSPEYMAPEIIDPKARQCGYTKCVDWWSLGVVTFELMAGQTPFQDEEMTGDFDWYGMLKAQKAGVPPGALPAGSPVSSLKFIWRLLKVDPEKRLGAGGAEEVRKHDWFSQARFDFEGLRNGNLPAPFTPQASIPKSSPPELWNKQGAVEVVVTQEQDMMIGEDGDRYQKDLTIGQAIPLLKGMAARDARDKLPDCCLGFTCTTPSTPDDIVPCLFKTHMELEEAPGWTSYHCHVDLFEKYEETAATKDLYKNFQLPESAKVRNNITKKAKERAGGQGKSSMIMTVEGLLNGWTLQKSGQSDMRAR